MLSDQICTEAAVQVDVTVTRCLLLQLDLLPLQLLGPQTSASVAAAEEHSPEHTVQVDGDEGLIPASTATTTSSISSKGLYMLVSAGQDNSVLQWDIAGIPSVINNLAVDEGSSELSAMCFLQDWAILATGEYLR